MSEYEIPCLQFDMTREPGESWGLKIAGGIDQDSSQNQFCPGDSGIFIISLDPNGLAAQFGEFWAILRVVNANLGLEVGDKILQVNSYDYTLVTLKQAEKRLVKKDQIRMKITRQSIQDKSKPAWGSSNDL